jgi:hypothetical protein
MIDMDRHVTASQQIKEDSDWTDLKPQLVLKVEGDTMVVLFDIEREEMMAAAMVQVIAQFHPTEVVWVADAWSLPVALDAVVTPNQAKEAFETGNPDATEALHLIGYDGVELTGRIVPYDSGRRTWLAAIPPTTPTGFEAEVLKAAWHAGFEIWHQDH